MVILWYGLIPMFGALGRRYKWRLLRKRFNELRLRPILNYRRYWQKEADDPQSNTFRFVGGFESVTDGQTLWIRSDDLTVPVSLKNASTYLLPMQKNEGTAEIIDPDDETPEKIKWERVSALTEGASVFVGGVLANLNGRRSFASTKENPLIVIFFDGPGAALPSQVIKAGRHRNDYWNSITPYSLIVGALCQILMAVTYLSRPAYRLTVVVSFIALFIPLYPIIPPGLLFTVLHRRLIWRARLLRVYADNALLPLCYLAGQGDSGIAENCMLPGGEAYGFVRMAELPLPAQEGNIPMLLPELAKARAGGDWLVFGSLRDGEELPCQSEDPFATFGILPHEPQKYARRYMTSSYLLETLAWFVLLAGVALNIFFLSLVLSLL